jgi:hypothetical protein
VVVASGEAFAHIAGPSAGACWVAVVDDTALAVTGDILEAFASAWEDTEDSHVVGSHLAAGVAAAAAAAVVVAEAAHMGCIGRLDRPGAASCIADPWYRRLRGSAVTKSRGIDVA